jgi:hypothetical protein
MSDPRIRVIRAGGEADVASALERLDKTIRVELPAGEIPLPVQLLSLTLVELLAKLFPRVDVLCDPSAAAHPSLPPGPPTLRERFDEARRRGHPPEAIGEPAFTVGIRSSTHADVYADGSGWQSYVGHVPSRLDESAISDLPVGPFCAAARAAAQVFELALDGLIGHFTPINACYWSALDYHSSSDPQPHTDTASPHEISAAMVGLGSVGGAAVFLLRHVSSLRGTLALIDPQVLESHNYVRAILATHALANGGAVKVEVAAPALEHHSGLNLDPRQETIADYAASFPADVPLPVVVCSVDSIPARRSIQDCMPLEIVNAACSSSQAMVSVHRTDHGPCLYCAYIEQVLDKDNILIKLIARATGLPLDAVNESIVGSRPLDEPTLKAIAAYREVEENAFAAYLGRTIVDLYRAELAYGETPVGAGGAAVAAPFITALAGFLLGGETLKAGTHALQAFRLGAPGGLTTDEGARPTKYEESLYASPADALLVPLPRWDTPACLCRSERRVALMRARYGLGEPPS